MTREGVKTWSRRLPGGKLALTFDALQNIRVQTFLQLRSMAVASRRPVQNYLSSILVFAHPRTPTLTLPPTYSLPLTSYLTSSIPPHASTSASASVFPTPFPTCPLVLTSLVRYLSCPSPTYLHHNDGFSSVSGMFHLLFKCTRRVRLMDVLQSYFFIFLTFFLRGLFTFNFSLYPILSARLLISLSQAHST